MCFSSVQKYWGENHKNVYSEPIVSHADFDCVPELCSLILPLQETLKELNTFDIASQDLIDKPLLKPICIFIAFSFSSKKIM